MVLLRPCTNALECRWAGKDENEGVLRHSAHRRLRHLPTLFGKWQRTLPRPLTSRPAEPEDLDGLTQRLAMLDLIVIAITLRAIQFGASNNSHSSNPD
jgi:hypothetical protein